jgi:hypothetical protein
MQLFSKCNNIQILGDEFTSGFLGLHWFPSAGSSANKQHYENDVLAALNRLIKTYTGWCVINEVYYQRPRQMLIMPYHPTPERGTFNATAAATDTAAATLKGTVARDEFGQLPEPGSARVIGTGAGSNTVINFTPSIFAGLPGAPTGPGATTDEILLHEMVHGLRQMMGRSVRETVVNAVLMDNYEEFAAIVVTNVYRSEVRMPQLRRDHWGFNPLTGTEATTAGFKSAYGSYLGYMDIETPRLCANLRRAGVAFNPF